MPDEPTNRELKIMFDNAEKRSDEKHKELLEMLSDVKVTGESTLIQARATNGKVIKHEWYFRAMWWALGAAWVMILIGIPLLYQFLIFTLDIKIKDGVASALKDNVSSIEYEN